MDINYSNYGKVLLIGGLAAGLAAGCAVSKHQPDEKHVETNETHTRPAPVAQNEPAKAPPPVVIYQNSPSYPQSSLQEAGIAGDSSSTSAQQTGDNGQAVKPEDLGKVQSRSGSTNVQGSREVIRRDTVKFKANIPTITQDTTKADINRMTARDFVALGLSRDQADEVIRDRDRMGRFQSVDDLKKIPKLDQAWLNQNADRLGVSSSETYSALEPSSGR